MTIGATVVVDVVVVMVGATVVVVVVVAVEARQVVGAAAAQVIGAQVPPKIPHWTVHWAEPDNTSFKGGLKTDMNDDHQGQACISCMRYVISL